MRTITAHDYREHPSLLAEADQILARLGIPREDVHQIDIADDGSVDVLVYLRDADGRFFLTPDREVASRVVHDG